MRHVLSKNYYVDLVTDLAIKEGVKKTYLLGGILLAASIGLAGCTPFWAANKTMVKPEAMMEADKMMAEEGEDGAMAKDTMMAKASYEVYGADTYAKASAKRRVLFFHATWCPTCKAANLDLEKNIGMLPDDVVIFKTDYDSRTELKKKYNITYQHTFVLVDEMGKELMKWNGGETAMIKEKLK